MGLPAIQSSEGMFGMMQKIKEKKEKILSFCIVDELQMLYMGTEEAKILSYNLKDLFASHVNRGISSIEVERLNENELKRIL